MFWLCLGCEDVRCPGFARDGRMWGVLALLGM